MVNYKAVNLKQSFPNLEEEIIKFWKENKIFEESIKIRENSPEFNFYDGPPFATGTPHYGHILAGTIKDVVPRYQTMKGFRVDRKFGWDCHGLPIENIVEKKMGISGKDDIEKKIGVYNFNEECRANVFTYAHEWEKTVSRMGRWVDMKNDYKTMDTNFMESVWWVYKELYKKGLIYEGYRVVPYCPRCSTPLSNFEVNQGYKDKQDKTATVKFKVTYSPLLGGDAGKAEGGKYILAWTTTPWTLAANLGLAVGIDIDYVELLDNKTKETYIIAKERIGSYYKKEEDYTIAQEYKGKCLVGTKYEPIFGDFWAKHEINDMPKGMELGENAYSVIIGHHVTTESGTGIVHIAPAYGEDDYIIGQKQNLGFVSHIDDTGKTEHIANDKGMQVFDFNEKVILNLKEKNQIVQINTIDHSYPHCWRCDSPLIYRAINAWYVAVEQIRDKMVANNERINWTPDIIKHGRFGTWIENARDWNISRNRYWGSAIPVWQSEDKSEEVCIGSVNELYELNKDFEQIEKKDGKYYYTNTGLAVDIHKHFVDEIKIKNPKTGNTLNRIPEVLDCWFESGAMPYASKHYPFETNISPLLGGDAGKAELGNFKFPADFIAEGIDQTRGWFYTLLILGTALFDNTPFLNVIVNGTVLAEDGHKMSKSKKNYPDPKLIFDKYGADAMRFYLMNSPVVEAQDFRFAEIGVEEVVKKVILPFWNTYYFFTTYANIDKFLPKKGNIYYVRHGETDNNKNGIVNGGDNDLDLNETGINQAIELGKKIASQNIKFDIIISSPLSRAKNTAKYIKEQLSYDIEIIIENDLIEQKVGEFKGKTHDEMIKKYNCKNNNELRRVYRENSVENTGQYIDRVKKAYKKIEEKYRGKDILIVAHGGTIRPINSYLNNLTKEEAFYEIEGGPKNSTLYKIPNYIKNNNLDKWIISELNKLIAEVTLGFDSYKLNEATKPIVKFMDNLTNWYIRRSRKRFWKSENDGDKIEAYNTLYDVLVEITKIISPFMPFISEYIYKELTGKKSVHLCNFPESLPSFIMENLNINTENAQKIITLGLAFRANNKIRVRQPLRSITITEKLSDYYTEIIKEELNVKEVIVVDGNSLAKQVCKPNGRNIGPKFGANVKFIITEAKSGNFKLLKNGNVFIPHPNPLLRGEGKDQNGFELDEGDFELVFESGNSNLKIESGFGMVISMDDKITPELKLEGFARDLVRHIQEARKEANFNVEDRIEISISGAGEVLEKYSKYIENETLSKINNSISKANLEKDIEIEDLKINLKLKK